MTDRNADDQLINEVRDVVGDELLARLARASRDHDVTISIIITPTELVDTSRDPNDR